jgi:hypothetical protein
MFDVPIYVAIGFFALVVSVANMWAGYEKGDRYSGGAAIATLGYLLVGWVGPLTGLGFILWRLVGWQKSHDMGRSDTTLLRDFFVFGAIAGVPSTILAIYHMSYVPFAFMFAAPACYVFALYAVPYRPPIKHLRIGEGLSGIALGILATIPLI